MVYSSRNPKGLKSLARQNVIFEFGVFQGLLGRENVCPLNGNVEELPSDYLGVVLVRYDSNEIWKRELVRELANAGFDINPKKV